MAELQKNGRDENVCTFFFAVDAFVQDYFGQGDGYDDHVLLRFEEEVELAIVADGELFEGVVDVFEHLVGLVAVLRELDYE